MANFNNPHHFGIYVGRDFNQVDNSNRGHLELKTLVSAACPGAGHESAERADPPKCHPNTRLTVISEIMEWVDSEDLTKRIMWLNGAAGVGKSAIAQTIAERCSQEGKLISSFFFSRTATTAGRNEGSRLIPTIAYHLVLVIPETKELVLLELDRDPGLLQKSMKIQLNRLIVNPLTHFCETSVHTVPSLVIIDGLDECNEAEVQSRIIKTIGEILAESPIHLRFLIASRPEMELVKMFSQALVSSMTVQLTLDFHYNPKEDIQTYLEDEFRLIKQTHFLKEELSNDHNWPSKFDLRALVYRSSGQFIYASTVLKFIAKDDRDPREALQSVIHNKYKEDIPEEESPYAQLDALYMYILSSASAKTKGGYNAIMDVLRVLALTGMDYLESTSLAELLGITESNLQLRLVHLHSIVLIPSRTAISHPFDSHDSQHIQFHHASIKDFLLDSSRSECFSIDAVKGHVFLGHCCMAVILHMIKSMSWSNEIPVQGVKSEINNLYNTVSPAQKYALQNYFLHIEHSKFDDQLLNQLFQREYTELIMYFMVSNIPYDIAKKSLCPVLIFNFYSDIFVVPASKEKRAEAICSLVTEVIDQFILENFVDTGEVLYAKCIASLIGERRNLAISITDNIIQCWAGALMENSVRGNHIYLSNEKSQVVFRCILKQISELSLAKLTESEDGIDIGHSFFKAFNVDVEWYPLVLEYLLKRIKPSFDFKLFIQTSHSEFENLYSFLDLLRDTLRSEGFKTKIRYNRVEKNMSILMEAVVDYLKQCDNINEADVPCINNNSQFQVTGSQEPCPQPPSSSDQEVQDETTVHGNFPGPESQADFNDTVGHTSSSKKFWRRLLCH